jgi:hypothetical protein
MSLEKQERKKKILGSISCLDVVPLRDDYASSLTRHLGLLMFEKMYDTKAARVVTFSTSHAATPASVCHIIIF